MFFDLSEAAAPALFPNINNSANEFPPNRLAPCRPAVTSPAAYKPSTPVECSSGVTTMPPIE